MSRPRLLDLFCGAGGAAMGYHRAGFDVVGVDNRPQPNYPFEFWQWDALTWLECIQYRGFDAIHASPPCQAWSQATHTGKGQLAHPDLVGPTRSLLEQTRLPFVIENVPQAPLRHPILLCGSMFDPPLDVKRHRHFEANWPLEAPIWGCRHLLWGRDRFQIALSQNRKNQCRSGASAIVSIAGSSGNHPNGGADLWRRVMDMPWATAKEIGQAIPPLYTEFIGEQLVKQVSHGAR